MERGNVQEEIGDGYNLGPGKYKVLNPFLMSDMLMSCHDEACLMSDMHLLKITKPWNLSPSKFSQQVYTQGMA